MDVSPDLARSTWFVIPLFNEETMITEVVASVRSTFPNVVCVDDGSHDASAAAAETAGARVVRHPVNLGQGAALQTGISFALARPETETIVTFDADGQHQVSDVLVMIERLHRDDLDAVFGSRFLDKRTKPGFFKSIVLRLAVKYTNATTGLRLTDAHNGLRVFSRNGAAALTIRQNRMAHASEIVTLASRAKLAVGEEPVHIVYSDYSRAKGQPLLNAVNILIDLVIK